MRIRLLIFLAIIVTSIGCQPDRKSAEVVQTNTKEKFTEQHRPQFHFSPPTHWMNDPNGLVYYRGEYHLFYQHYPDSMRWGPMHWGHAVSKDLFHWEHLPIALYPDSLGMIFSGSAVVDSLNTSGLGSATIPPLVAMFTYHKMEREKAGAIDYQSQGIAFSTDKGRSWTKYSANPVIKNPGVKDFRDPKMFWHKPSMQWITTLVAGDHAEFFGSKDLIHWTKLGEFGREYGDHGGVWECPDLFELPVQGESEKKWVLIISINPGAPQGGSASQYFVGNFDGKKFTCDTEKTKSSWLDYGQDNYAGVTWSNAPNDRKIFQGWMSNWDYAQNVPTSPWRSAMTVPRDLSLVNINGEYLLKNTPVGEVLGQARDIRSFADLVVKDSFDVSDAVSVPLSQSILEGAIEAKSFEIVFANSKGEKYVTGFDASGNKFFSDRAKSGKTGFSDKFKPIQFAPRFLRDGMIQFRIVADVSSFEVFYDDGLSVLTSVVFPNEDFSKVVIRSKGADVQLPVLSIKQVPSIWSHAVK
jgi:fructan beta-fructosidase